MEQETKHYLERWGHLPFWDDFEGFNKRVKLEVEKYFNKRVKMAEEKFGK